MAVQGTVTRSSSSSTLDGSLACDAGAESHTLDGERVTLLASATATAEGSLKAAAVLDPLWGRPVSADNVPAFMLAQTGLDNEQKLQVALCRRQAWLRAFQLGPTLALWTYAGCVMLEASKLIKLPKGTQQAASLAAAVGGMTLGAYIGGTEGKPTMNAALRAKPVEHVHVRRSERPPEEDSLVHFIRAGTAPRAGSAQ